MLSQVTPAETDGCNALRGWEHYVLEWTVRSHVDLQQAAVLYIRQGIDHALDRAIAVIQPIIEQWYKYMVRGTRIEAARTRRCMLIR